MDNTVAVPDGEEYLLGLLTRGRKCPSVSRQPGQGQMGHSAHCLEDFLL